MQLLSYTVVKDGSQLAPPRKPKELLRVNAVCSVLVLCTDFQSCVIVDPQGTNVDGVGIFKYNWLRKVSKQHSLTRSLTHSLTHPL